MTTLRLMYIATGLLLAIISIPLILRKIGPNPVYGFRVKQTLEDDQVWYDVNAFAARGLFLDGLITVVAALVLALVPDIGVDRYALTVTAIVFIALGLTLLASFRHLGRVTSSKDARTPARSGRRPARSSRRRRGEIR